MELRDSIKAAEEEILDLEGKLAKAKASLAAAKSEQEAFLWENEKAASAGGKTFVRTFVLRLRGVTSALGGSNSD